MHRLKLVAFIFIFLISGAASFGQDISIQIDVYNADLLETLYISDLDLEQLGSAEELFGLTFIKNTDQGFPRCRLTLRFTRDDQELAYTESDTFAIPAGPMPPATVSNVELANNSFYFDPGVPATRIRMTRSKLRDEIKDLQQEVLTSGKAPIGIYKIEATLINVLDSDQILGYNEASFISATNPGYIQLVTPGSYAGSWQNMGIYSEYPVFQWNGNGQEYQVLVFEKKHLLQTLDDILNSQPHWESERLNSLSAIYPQGSEALPLEFGKTYYWLVKMFIQTSAGEDEVTSEIWEFTVVDPESRQFVQGIFAKNELIAFLRDVLGKRADQIEARLDGYHLETIHFNGQEIRLEDLYKIINDYRQKEVEIVDVIMPGLGN